MEPEIQDLIDGLNEDLEGELQAIITYIIYPSRVQGLLAEELRDFFYDEIKDETKHAKFISDQIVRLGGIPSTNPRPVPEAADTQSMLQNVLAAEKRAVKDYTARTVQVDNLDPSWGLKGLCVALENQIVDEMEHRQKVERLLGLITTRDSGYEDTDSSESEDMEV
jgi:bacterioferritin